MSLDDEADDGLPNVPAQPQQVRRAPRFTIAISTLWQQLILSGALALLGFLVFVFALAWDQVLWLAAVGFLVGLFAAIYALWCGMILRRAELRVP